MVKRREPPTNAEINAFASGAEKKQSNLDPSAKRKFKAITVPFNEYEYQQLVLLSTKTGRAKVNAIRWAIMKLLEEIQN